MFVSTSCPPTTGKKQQSVLLKLCSWRARDLIYCSRKQFPFKVNHDLTKKRRQLLDFASETIEEDESVSNLVSYAFADRNCKMKFKTVDNKFYGFSTKNEFMALLGSSRCPRHLERMKKTMNYTTEPSKMTLVCFLTSFYINSNEKQLKFCCQFSVLY